MGLKLPINNITPYASIGLGVRTIQIYGSGIENYAGGLTWFRNYGRRSCRSCCILPGGQIMTLFVRLIGEAIKQDALVRFVTGYRQGGLSHSIADVDARTFEFIPGSPFAYWTNESVRNVFSIFPEFDCEENGRATRCCQGSTRKKCIVRESNPGLTDGNH